MELPTYETPFLLARRYSTLDHLTNGRVAWNVVTSYLESAAKNLGRDKEVSHDERYEIADEFLDVVHKLLEGSWRDDAMILDNELKSYTHPDRVRRINHKGASKAGKTFATKHAEAMFLPGMHIESVKKSVVDIRQTAVDQGRDVRGLKLIVGMLIIVDETDELAQQKYDEYLSYADLDGSLAQFGGWTGEDLGKYGDDDDFEFTGPGAIQSMVSSWRATIPGSEGIKWTKKRVAQELALRGPHPRAIGSAKTVVDILERWIAETDVDGFNISYAVGPGDLEDVVKYLVPELKARGVFWNPIAAEGKTARENYHGPEFAKTSRLSSDHPGAKYRWTAPESAEGN